MILCPSIGFGFVILSESMRGSFRGLLRKFCLDGTVSGLKYFYLYTDKASRCFWGIFVVFILYFAVLLACLLYQRFQAMPTRITIENQFEPVAPLPFPAITLCSPNQITLSAVDHFSGTLVNGYNSSFDLEQALQQMLGYYYFVDFDQATLNHLQHIIEINRYTVPEVLVLLSQSCDDFLKLCLFKRRRYPRCRGLFKPLLTKHGLCCIFNSMYYYGDKRRNERDMQYKPWLVERHDWSQGLTVITDYNPVDALDHSIHYSGATRVMFTDWTEFPADDESLLVAPNTESFHFIHATAIYCSADVKELPQSSRKCSFEDETRLPYFRRYRNSDCDLLCLVQSVEKQCDCLLFYLPHLNTQKTCGINAVPCIMKAKLSLSEGMLPSECECPRDCDTRQYRVDVSMGNLGGLPYAVKEMPANLQINTSSSLMRFFFQTSVYEKQKQETVMSYTTLASNLGGVFGLCLGCSLVSVLELWFYQYCAVRSALAALRPRPRPRTAPAPSSPPPTYYYE